jgi:hypothetical protein
VLSDADVAFYRENGYLHLEGLFSMPEIERLREVSDGLIRYAMQSRVPHPDFAYQPSPAGADLGLRGVMYPKRRAVEFQALYGHPGLLEVYESLLGPDFVITDDLLVVKLPGDGLEVPWHRDLGPGMSRAGDSLTAPGIELDFSLVDNGCVRVLPGTHKLGVVDIEAMVREAGGFDLPGAVAVETKPGDVVVHTGNLIHGSPYTHAGTLRRTIYITAFEIDEYQSVYGATPELIRMQRACMMRAIQLRRTLDYARGEEPPVIRCSPEWAVEVDEDDYVEWGLVAARPAA